MISIFGQSGIDRAKKLTEGATTETVLQLLHEYDTKIDRVNWISVAFIVCTLLAWFFFGATFALVLITITFVWHVSFYSTEVTRQELKRIAESLRTH